MIIIGNKPGRFFSSDRDDGEPSATLADNVASYSNEDLFADPEVCRRVGRIIAKGAGHRRPQRSPTPRRNDSDGSND
jgi:hypothetical protein